MDLRYSERLATKPRLDYNTMEQRTDSFGEKRPRVDTHLEEVEPELELEAEVPGCYDSYCHPILLVNFLIVCTVCFTLLGYSLDAYSVLHCMTPTQHPL